MDLFTPLKIGDLELPNRIVMSPLTRCRAGESRVPNDLMVEYYRQRSSAGMIITEATSVSPMGVGYPGTPGIWSSEQVDGWSKITESVHAAGGKIILQLWHVGRISDPIYLNGELPVAPSAIAPKGHVSLVRPKKEFVTPRALSTEEVYSVIEEFRLGAENAKKSGFDGVEIHGANGYLLDQFLQDSTNKRTDEFGGSLENRAKLHLEITKAVLGVWPTGRVGMHLAPRADAHDMEDSNLQETFVYLATELGRLGIAFICAREHLGADSIGPKLKEAFGGVFIANENFDFESATSAIQNNTADAVAFGKLFIANPDLPRRFKEQLTLNPQRPDLFYAEGPEGYTDYPFA
ncbi:MAG: alkene reductase [Bdellovibrionales bacterium]|nr:alkene reductase [Bdellovibrionales bacterium]